MALTEQQCAFFETFGFLVFPQMLADDLPLIVQGFEEVFAARAQPHDGTRRTIAGTDSSERLCRLLDHPKVVEVASSLVGDGFNYLGRDANYYVGDTGWHSDGWHDVGLYVKMAFYLDPVTHETGCLRVIPGSHHVGNDRVRLLRRVNNLEQNFGVSGRDVPSVALESTPGDVVVFNHNLHHAAYGGGNRRRQPAADVHLEPEPPYRLPRSDASSRPGHRERGRFARPGQVSETMGELARDLLPPLRYRLGPPCVTLVTYFHRWKTKANAPC